MKRLALTIVLLAFCTPALAQTVYVSDTFTAPNGTALNGRRPETTLTGALWNITGTEYACPMIVNGAMQPVCADSGTFINLGYVNSGLSDAVVGVDWTPLP